MNIPYPIFYVYIISNEVHTVFYIGVTNNIKRRTLEHKEGIGSAFTSKYNLKYLLYYEKFDDINNAIKREKNLKNWHRDWKINLIKEKNPEMKDLAHNWFTKEQIGINNKGKDAETSSA